MIRWPWSKASTDRAAAMAEAVRAQEEAHERLLRTMEEARGRDVAAMLVGLVPVRRGRPE